MIKTCGADPILSPYRSDPYLPAVYIHLRHLRQGQHQRLGTCHKPTLTRTSTSQRYGDVNIYALEPHLAFHSAQRMHSYAQTCVHSVHRACFLSTSPRMSPSPKPFYSARPYAATGHSTESPGRSGHRAPPKRCETHRIHACAHIEYTPTLRAFNAILKQIPHAASHWRREGCDVRCKQTMHRSNTESAYACIRVFWRVQTMSEVCKGVFKRC